MRESRVADDADQGHLALRNRAGGGPSLADDARQARGGEWDANFSCHSCDSHGLSIFYEVESVPVHSCLLLPSREDAMQYPKGKLRLGFCRSCGFISNVLFDPSMLNYSSSYEETQGFSPRFQAFTRDLAGRLIDRYDLRGKEILEIGCGKGEFLVLLCELGHNRGIGIDPAYVEGRLPREATSQITFIKDFYSEKYAHLSGDFVCCRHTLEHIQPTRQFLQMARRSIGDRLDTIVFFEVPDVSRVLRELAFWDIYYEHCSYFSLGSLARLFRSSGFEVLDLARGFDDQYLLIEARPGDGSAGPFFPQEDDVEQLTQEVDHFRTDQQAKLEGWRSDLHGIRERGERAVIWGSGSKGVSYLTTLGIRDEIEFVVDINPFKHGMYLAGTGHKIVAPQFLKEYRPDIVIVMNPIYCEEIRSRLEAMGLFPELVAV
ncbi:MAG: class I SAM-dependent methyltransferase [Acidobacteriota bacterium]